MVFPSTVGVVKTKGRGNSIVIPYYFIYLVITTSETTKAKS